MEATPEPTLILAFTQSTDPHFHAQLRVDHRPGTVIAPGAATIVEL